MAKSAEVRVGVAGWDYPDWKGILYPAPKPRGFDPVRYLASYIDLIEINSTFYRPVSVDVGKKWAERVADFPDFRYTAKLYRRFTHERDTAWKAAEVKEAAAGLHVLNDAGVLDALLIQFPWSFRNSEDNREWLSDLVDAFGEFPLAIEVRHEGWNDPEFYEWLAESGAGFVNVDQPLFKKSIRPSARVTSHIGYVRVHGRNYHDWFRKNAGRDARYDYLYTPAELKPWVERTEEVARDRQTEKVDVVFNNHYKAQAVVNTIQFRALLEGEKVESPPILQDHYAKELKKFAIPTDKLRDLSSAA
jgi:uncharacterized protein YecE (DUF72 family)